MRKERSATREELITDLDDALVHLADDTEIALDLETSGLSPFRDAIAVVSLYGGRSDETAVLHVRGSLPGALREFLSRPDVLWVGHNVAGFDMLFLEQNGVDVWHTRYYDTLIGEQVTLTTGRRDVRVNLADTIARRLGVQLKKGQGTSSWMNPELTPEQWQYCASDVYYLLTLMREQLSKVAGTTQEAAMAFEQSLIPAVARMVINGMPLDLVALRQWRQEMVVEATEANRRLLQHHPGLNVGSPKQVLATFAATYDVHLLSSDKATLMSVAEYDTSVDPEDGGPRPYLPGQFAKDLLVARRERKRGSFYDDDWVREHVGPDGRVHPKFWQASTDTFRFSCIAEGQRVAIPGGWLPIEQVRVGEPVYTFDVNTGQPTIEPVLATMRKGWTPTVRVHWQTILTERTGSVVCTPDHRLYVPKKGWVAAEHLQAGDRLLFLSRGSVATSGRVNVNWTNKAHGVLEEQLVKTEWYKAASNMHAHHKDGNQANNAIANLQLLTPGEHTRLHYQQKTAGYAKFALLRALANVQGRLTALPGDFATWKQRAFDVQVDPRIVLERYSSTGVYLSRTRVVRALMHTETVAHAAFALGVGTRKLKGLCKRYDIEYNHRVTSVEPAGTRRVYDLTVRNTHTFVVEEICVANSSAPNMQQIPREGRKIFGGVYGHSIVSVDFAQLEVRVAAYLSRDMALVAALASSDMHKTVAAGIFQCPVEAVTTQQRQLAKAATFTLLFGGSAGGLVRYAHLSGSRLGIEDAQTIVTGFFRQFRGLAVMRETARRQGAQGRQITLTLASGAKRVLVPVDGQVRPSQILNTMVQSGAAIGMKHAILLAHQAGLTRYLGLTVHDELVGCVPDAEVTEFSHALQHCMIEGMRAITHDIPIAVEAKIGTHWR